MSRPGSDSPGLSNWIRNLDDLAEIVKHYEESELLADFGSWQYFAAENRLWWSPGMHRIFGISEQEFDGRQETLFEAAVPEDRHILTEAAERYAKTGVPDVLTYRIRRPDGEVRYIRAFGESFQDHREKQAARGYVQDITERILTETELKSSRAELERMVAARTRELEQAREEAEKANRAKGLFLARMSHELRTPLNAVIGAARLLEEEQSGDAKRIKEYIHYIGEAGRNLAEIVGEILALSQLEEGRTLLRKTALNLSEFVKSIVDSAQVMAMDKELTLRFSLQDDLPFWIEADRPKLRQILYNILGNAVKYTAKGFVDLSVSREEEAIIFQVQDSGPGIPPEALPELFQMYSDVHRKDIDPETPSTGLGLYIANALTRLMGGEIQVESEPGKGSVFRVLLPLVGGEPEESSATAELDLSRTRILIVEDNAMNALILKRLLESLGANDIIVATDGLQAVEFWQSHRPDCILMDIEMPRMDGLEATRLIRKESEGEESQAAILAITAGAFDDDRYRALEAGCDAFLAKPVSLESLKLTLWTVL
ncbi:MAG: hypothetical protein CMN76_13630 [Spirochaetaceae bacterium]|nr:hypothetical protein [Spirochaetaceae bacterium]|tara:strand:- start:317822 stop:319450 length:1629 start_codon:yes stop_codon:yes gene_type:complete